MESCEVTWEIAEAWECYSVLLIPFAVTTSPTFPQLPNLTRLQLIKLHENPSKVLLPLLMKTQTSMMLCVGTPKILFEATSPTIDEVVSVTLTVITPTSTSPGPTPLEIIVLQE